MADIYARTFDLTKLFLSLEKQHLDVVRISISEADDDPKYGGPAMLSVDAVNSQAPGVVSGESLDTDDSLSDYFNFS